MTSKSKLTASDELLIEKFRSLENRQDVASLLEITDPNLRYLLYSLGDANYNDVELRKRNGKIRTISVPDNYLKGIQRRLLYILNLLYKPKGTVHGYISERSIATNARNHVKKSYVLNIDLEDFFPTINFGRVRGLFIGYFKVPEKAATVLAQICCYKNSLPQGAPTSPVLSNIICSKLDKELGRYALNNHCDYTRYSDDISISTNRKIFPALIGGKNDIGHFELSDRFERIIRQNGFVINHEKVRLKSSNERQQVTGLIVNEGINVPRKFIRQIRSMLNAWNKYGYELANEEYQKKYLKKNSKGEPAQFREVVRGKINYLKMIRGEHDTIYKKLAIEYNRLNETGFPHYFVDDKSAIIESLWVIECEDTINQGTGFILNGIGLVSCHHVVGPKPFAYRFDNPRKKYKLKVILCSPVDDFSVLDFVDKPDFRLHSLNGLKRGQLEHGQSIVLAGFPNHAHGHSPYIEYGTITQFNSGNRSFVISPKIVTGNSGGPVLDKNLNVIGYATKGSKEFDDEGDGTQSGVTTIDAIYDFIES